MVMGEDAEHEAWRLLERCELCPRRCGVNRLRGQRGFCGMGAEAVVAAWLLHQGEEPPISGQRGAGAVFFSGCNLRCLYCQNHQISQGRWGRPLGVEELAGCFLELQARGAHNLELVSPSHFLPQILSALRIARQRGLRLPVVYNTNAYELPRTLELLRGAVDVYLPDLKYADPAVAERLSGAADYVAVARRAIRRMYEQVGPLVVDRHGLARRGLLVRHLVLPGGLAGSRRSLEFLASISTRIPISIMAQYLPLHRAREDPVLGRRLRPQEYEQVLEVAQSLGFEEIWAQELDSAPLWVPDFTSPRVFG